MTERTTNLERADHGMHMVYGEPIDVPYDRTSEEAEDMRIALTDALTDLMHYARRYNVDFGKALDWAERHHETEKDYAWEELSL